MGMCSMILLDHCRLSHCKGSSCVETRLLWEPITITSRQPSDGSSHRLHDNYSPFAKDSPRGLDIPFIHLQVCVCVLITVQ